MENKKIAAYTLGCKVNVYDTEAIMEMFGDNGYEIVDFESFADIYIINTCTVTNLGDKKSRQIIRRAKKINPNSLVVVVGCYAQVAPEEISLIEGVNIVIGTKDRKKIIEYVNSYDFSQGVVNNVSDIMEESDFEELSISGLDQRCRAYLKIQEGCDRYCTFCIIPYARGRARSRTPEDVLTETKKLAENGFKEIVFAGIHVASYGKDLGDITLIDIIEKVHEIDGIQRIRMSSIEPRIIDDEFIRRLKKLNKVCDHFHLSLQSGSNKTLKKMNRKYNKEEYKLAVYKLRQAFENISITTDVIVGFPDESDEDFRESFEFIKEIELSQLHVFPYSPKKGTPAANYQNQVDSAVKAKRAQELGLLGEELNNKFMERFIGQSLSVLFEKEKAENLYEGHSTNYIPVVVESPVNLINIISNVLIKSVENGVAFGELMTQN